MKSPGVENAAKIADIENMHASTAKNVLEWKKAKDSQDLEFSLYRGYNDEWSQKNDGKPVPPNIAAENRLKAMTEVKAGEKGNAKSAGGSLDSDDLTRRRIRIFQGISLFLPALDMVMPVPQMGRSLQHAITTQMKAQGKKRA